jgi:hypothetical protein
LWTSCAGPSAARIVGRRESLGELLRRVVVGSLEDLRRVRVEQSPVRLERGGEQLAREVDGIDELVALAMEGPEVTLPFRRILVEQDMRGDLDEGHGWLIVAPHRRGGLRHEGRRGRARVAVKGAEWTQHPSPTADGRGKG